MGINGCAAMPPILCQHCLQPVFCIALHSPNPVFAQPLTCADLHSLLLLATCLSLLFSPFSLISSYSTFLPHHLITLITSSMLHILAYVLPCMTPGYSVVRQDKGRKQSSIDVVNSCYILKKILHSITRLANTAFNKYCIIFGGWFGAYNISILISLTLMLPLL